MLANVDYQIHAYVNCTEDVELTRSIKWPDIAAASTDAHIVDCRRSLLYRQLGRAVSPRAICEYVQYLDIVDKRNFRTFGDIDAFLYKVGRIHVNGSTCAASDTAATTAARCWSGSCDGNSSRTRTSR